MLSNPLLVKSDVSNLAELYIPWNNTAALGKGVSGLNNMYNFLEDGSNLKMFIDKHCKFLLKPLQGHTGILKESLIVESLQDNVHTHKLSNNYSKLITKPYKNMCGVYVFFEPGKTGIVQCGSNLDFDSRMEVHYQALRKGDPKAFYQYTRENGGMSIYS